MVVPAPLWRGFSFVQITFFVAGKLERHSRIFGDGRGEPPPASQIALLRKREPFPSAPSRFGGALSVVSLPLARTALADVPRSAIAPERPALIPRDEQDRTIWSRDLRRAR